MKHARFRISVCIIAVLILCTASSFGCTQQDTNESALTLTVFSCGKADAMLLQFDGYSVMIDTGENGDGEQLCEKLKSLGVSKLDLLILTHHDKDHIGGADSVLYAIPTDLVRMPAYESDSKRYAELCAALKETGVPSVRMDSDETFSIGNADFTIWTSPIPYNGKSDNEQSLVTKVLYGGKTFLFMGDAEEDWLKELVFSTRNLTCDVLKLPHHGVYDKNLISLFAVTLPDIVLITDSEKNPVEAQTQALLDTFDCTVYATRSGTIRVSLQGGTLNAEQ